MGDLDSANFGGVGMENSEDRERVWELCVVGKGKGEDLEGWG